MTGKTHRVGGMLCALGGYTILSGKGMLLSDVSPLVQLTVMYPFAIYGSVVSDLDHNWNSAPSKDIVSWVINKVLHLTSDVRDHMDEKSSASKALSVFDAKHRSWQTHSDLFLVAMIFLAMQIMGSSPYSADQIIIKLITTGLALGIISHLFLDMLTPEGIWCILTSGVGKVAKIKGIPQKISFVPNTKFFRTGGPWETLVRYVMWVICLILLVRILYVASPYRISFLN